MVPQTGVGGPQCSKTLPDKLVTPCPALTADASSYVSSVGQSPRPLRQLKLLQGYSSTDFCATPALAIDRLLVLQFHPLMRCTPRLIPKTAGVLETAMVCPDHRRSLPPAENRCRKSCCGWHDQSPRGVGTARHEHGHRNSSPPAELVS